MNLYKILVFSFLSLLLLNFTIDNGWYPYRSIDGRFKVMVKGEFIKRSIKMETTGFGEIQAFHFSHQPEEGSDNLLYTIFYYDLPEGSLHSDSTELVATFLDNTVEQSVASVNGTLLYENEVFQQGFKGRSWRVHFADNTAIIRTKAFLVDNRFYTIQIVTLAENSINGSIDKFLDSFYLLGLD